MMIMTDKRKAKVRDYLKRYANDNIQRYRKNAEWDDSDSWADEYTKCVIEIGFDMYKNNTLTDKEINSGALYYIVSITDYARDLEIKDGLEYYYNIKINYVIANKINNEMTNDGWEVFCTKDSIIYDYYMKLKEKYSLEKRA